MRRIQNGSGGNRRGDPTRQEGAPAARLRFEFLAFTRFMGAAGAGADLQIHDGIAAALAAAGRSDTLVFSVSSGMWPQDLEHVLSRCVEKVAVAMDQWLLDPAIPQ